MERQQLIRLFEQGYDPDAWRGLLRHLFPNIGFASVVQERRQEIGAHADVKSIRLFADHRLQDKSRVAFYEVELVKGKQVTGRVSLRNIIARDVIPDNLDAIIATYYAPDSNEWRVSLISKSMYWEDAQKLVQHETHPKRYTYVLGEGQRITTAVDQFLQLHDHMRGAADLKGLVKAFSVEKVSKEFFEKYYQFFLVFEEYLTNNTAYFKYFQKQVDRSLPAEQQDEEAARHVRNFVKKLLGRIVFLYFLQKKGWMGVPKDGEWGDGAPDFISRLFATAKDKGQFYKEVLVPLFFKTLNRERKDDLFELNGTKVPFLNGGLFDDDGTEPMNVRFEPQLWTDLFAFFDSYNFTIDENIPDDQDIGIDPEMLGQIFEQMLEEKRKSGTFYTPKEIVHYMCQESLICYLRSKLPECTEDESQATKAIERLIRQGDVGDRFDKKNFIVLQAKRIEKQLDAVKICDPAIGSGAFPMGMLQEIFHAKMVMDLTLDRTEVKKQIIQNSVYGVDLEEGAVDIARLRFWLTLVVEETKPSPLPNLDYKIMQGNSLLERYLDIDLSFKRKAFVTKLVKQVDLFGKPVVSQISIEEFLQTKEDTKEFNIVELEEKFFNTNNTAEKLRIRASIDAFEKEFIIERLDSRIYELEADYAELSKKAEAVKGAQQNEMKRQATTKADEAKQLRLAKRAAKEQLVRLKLLGEVQRLKEHRVQVREMKATNKPYFLWHLYFMDVFDQGGFDIVIANPPYIQLQKMGKAATELEAAGYETFKKTGDIYCLFYEKGFQLLKEHGVLCYITSNSWMQTDYGGLLRKYFREKTNPKVLLNFEDSLLFENATVEANILIAQKQSFSENLYAVAIDKSYKPGRGLFQFTTENGIRLRTLNDEGWLITDEATFRLLKTIEKGNTPLSKLGKINRGIVTGFNEAFIVPELIKNKLVQLDPTNKQILKPLLSGKHLRKYYHSNTEEWLVNTHNGVRKLGIPAIRVEEDYPSIFEYLKQYELELKQRRDQGDTWLNLRNCAYVNEFDLPKIIWAELSDIQKFSYDDEGFYLNKTCFFLTGERLKFLTAVLNSAISMWYFNAISTTSGMGTTMWSKYKVEQLPIPPVQREAEVEQLVNHVIARKKEKLDSMKWENKLDALVFHFYGLSEADMNLILDTFDAMSIKDRNQIQNEYWNVGNGKFRLEVG